MKKLKMLSLFSGIGAPEKALERLGFDVDLVGISEIDKFAVKSFLAVHEKDAEVSLGDITKIDITTLPKDLDLITHGSPCQDFSIAGKQRGGDAGTGTRSSLMWNTVDIIKETKPKYVVWENVKNLLSVKHRHNFDSYLETLEDLGYNNYYQVLNAKDYGVPQNRERVFTISIRKDIDGNNFKFPEKQPLNIRLRDILEPNVDEKYYLSDETIEKIKNSNFKQQKARIENGDVCRTLCARDYKDPQCVRVGGIFDKDGSTHQAGSVWDADGLAPTLDTMQGGWRQPSIIEEPKVVKLANETGNHYGGGLYDTDGISPTLVSSGAGGGTNNIPKVITEFVMPEEDRPKGNYLPRERVLSTDGISRAVTTSESQMPYINEKPNVVIDKSIKPSVAKNFEREKYDIVESEKEIYQCECESGFQDNKVGIKVSPTLRANNNHTSVLEEIDMPSERFFKQALETVQENDCDNGDTVDAFNKRVNSSGICPTLTTRPEGFKTAILPIQNYRIRKLTPLECWRLMGFDDSDFNKAKSAGISNSQLYKQAGNSIVVNVLEAIFENLIVKDVE